MQSILLDLNRSSRDIEASAIISKDGVVMATALPNGLDEDNLGAISAYALVMADYTSKEYNSGLLEHIVIKSTQHNLLIAHIDKEVLLVLVLKVDALIEPIAANVKRFRERIVAQLMHF